MYWRLTSKEKPIKQGKLKVIVAWETDKVEDTEYDICEYYSNSDASWYIPNYLFRAKPPTHWSYIDELPSEGE